MIYLRKNDYTIYYLKSGDHTFTALYYNTSDITSHTLEYFRIRPDVFMSIQSEEIEDYLNQQRILSDYINWSSRSDGHGGSKGGTLEEYLKTKNITNFDLDKYNRLNIPYR